MLEIKQMLGAISKNSKKLNSVFLASLSLILCKDWLLPDSSFSTSNTAACERLVKREFAPHELPSPIEAIFWNNGDSEMIRCLPRDDAKIFVDVIDEARSTFTRYHETNIVPATRHWVYLAFPHRLKRNSLDCYTGRVPNTQSFREL